MTEEPTPWVTGLTVAGFVAAVVGAALTVAVGLPALRRPGLFLAVTTLAFALVTPRWLLPRTWMLGSGVTMTRPELAGVDFGDQHAYYLQTLSYFSARFKSQELRESVLRADDPDIHPIAAFVMKEAAYKAWSDLGGEIISPLEVRLHVEGGAFTAEMPTPKMIVHGTLTNTGESWIAIATIR